MQILKIHLKRILNIYRSIPAIIPTDGPIGDRFGMRSHPILKIRRMHTGIDILVNNGENIYAPGDGIVVKANNRSGYGKTIEIDHGHGYTTLYAHLSKLKVKQGQSVKRGDLLGLSGETGSLATGPHLHYEVKHNGVHLNPKNFIFSDIKAFDLTYRRGVKLGVIIMIWTIELASYLIDAPWPASKEELIEYADRIGSPLEVIENLQELEDDEELYENIEDIWPDYPTDEDFFYFDDDDYN